MFYSLKNQKWSDFKEFEDSLPILSKFEIDQLKDELDLDFSKFLYEIRNNFHIKYPTCINWGISNFEEHFQENNNISKMCEIFEIENEHEFKISHRILRNLVDNYICDNPEWKFLIQLNYKPFHNLIDLYNSKINKFYVLQKR